MRFGYGDQWRPPRSGQPRMWRFFVFSNDLYVLDSRGRVRLWEADVYEEKRAAEESKKS